MKDKDKTKEQLVEELQEMRRKLAEFQAALEPASPAERAQFDDGAQDLVKVTKERLEAILNATTDVACLTDSSGVYLALNEAVARRLGRKVDELLGKVAYQFFPPEVAARRRDRLARVIRTSKPFREEEESQGRIFDESLFPILDSEGNVKAVAIFARDITEQKRAEKALLQAHDELDKRVQERTTELSRANAHLTEEISRRQGIQEELAKSELLHRMLVETAKDIIWSVDLSLKYTYVSPSVQAILGYTVDEIRAMNPLEVLTPSSRELIRRAFEKELRSELPQPRDKFISRTDCIEHFHKNGGTVWIEITTTFIRDENGAPTGVLGISRDITKRKIAENKLKESVKENEVLLREVHHRVKNNLQVVSSLLSLQSRNIREKTYEQMFEESHNRIQSMALIHEKLYQGRDLAHIDFKGYTRSLLAHLFHSFGVSANQISVQLDIEAVPLAIDTATPCALITNELVSNCLKHAFPDNRPGTIKIAFASHDHGFNLVISDDGVGLPENTDFKSPQTLGLRLVNTLVRQLGGRMEVNHSNGTEFKIQFNKLSNKATGAEILDRSRGSFA
jgi:PAS domain S-box-containing protein